MEAEEPAPRPVRSPHGALHRGVAARHRPRRDRRGRVAAGRRGLDRFFPASQPGYGFVSPDVPELTIGVAAPWRGRGAGRALLRAIAGLAEQAGIKRISLSVERKNFARALYLSEGYAVADATHPQSDTMVKSLSGTGW